MSHDKKKGMNLPNKLTVLRICFVPIFIVVMMLPDWECCQKILHLYKY